MDWLAPAVLKVSNLGEWAPVVFVALYIVAAVTLVPASLLLTVSAGAMFGVWRGSLLVFIGASLGASLVYALASPLAGSRWMQRVTGDRRVDALRTAAAGEGVRIMFLLRLSPITPYSIVNYALALSGVRFTDFLAALHGMIPVIIMSTYYGQSGGRRGGAGRGRLSAARAGVLRVAGRRPRRHHRVDDTDYTGVALRHRGAAASMIHSTRSTASRPAEAGFDRQHLV